MLIVKPFGIEESISNIADEKERGKKREAAEVFLQHIMNLSEEDLEDEADVAAKKNIAKHADDKDLFIDIIGGLLGYTNIRD